MGSLSPSVAEELARGLARALPLVERLDPIHEDVLVALGVLDPTPLAAGEVVHRFADPLGLFQCRGAIGHVRRNR